MATYSLYQQTNPAASVNPGHPGISYSGTFTSEQLWICMQSGMWLEGYWYYSDPDNPATGPITFATWCPNTTGDNTAPDATDVGTLLPGSATASGSVLAAGWNYIPLTEPCGPLGPGASYVATANFTGNFNDTADYFGTGPGANGIWSAGSVLYAPPGSGMFNTDVGPASVSTCWGGGNDQNSNFWVDVQVSDMAEAGDIDVTPLGAASGSVTFVGSTGGLALSTSSPETLALPTTTNAGDCLVVCVSIQGTGAVTVSGAGATWVEAIKSNATGPECVVWVGYGCAAGETSVTITYTGGYSGTYTIGQFSGVESSSSPVVTSDICDSTSDVNSLTTPAVSYSPGQAVIAAMSVYDPGQWGTVTWSNGATTRSLGSVNSSNRCINAQFLLPTSAASTTATFTWPNSDTALGGILALAAAPAAPASVVMVTPPTASASATAYEPSVSANSAAGAPYQTSNIGFQGLSSSSASTSFTVDNVAVGDLLVISVASYGSKTLAAVSGGGVSQWNVATPELQGSFATGLAWGTVTTAGAATCTVGMTGQTGGVAVWGEFGPSGLEALTTPVGAGAASIESLTLAMPSPTSPPNLAVIACYPTGSSVTGPADFTPINQAAQQTLGYFNPDYTTASSVTISQGTSGTIVAIGQLFGVPSTSTTASAGLAPASATVYAPTNAITVTPLVAAASATAHQPSVSTVAAASANAGLAGASASAYAPSVTLEPSAGSAAASASAHGPVTALGLAPGTASTTAIAHAPVAGVGAAPLVEPASATAHSPSLWLTVTPVTAAASATAYQPTVSEIPVVTAPAALAGASANAHTPTVALVAPVGLAGASVRAHTPAPTVRATSSTAAASATVHQPTGIVAVTPITAAASAAAHQPTVDTRSTITVAPDLAGASATVHQAGITATISPTRAGASASTHTPVASIRATASVGASASAHQPEPVVRVTPATAAASATTYQPGVITAGHKTVSVERVEASAAAHLPSIGLGVRSPQTPASATAHRPAPAVTVTPATASASTSSYAITTRLGAAPATAAASTTVSHPGITIRIGPTTASILAAAYVPLIEFGRVVVTPFTANALAAAHEPSVTTPPPIFRRFFTGVRGSGLLTRGIRGNQIIPRGGP